MKVISNKKIEQMDYSVNTIADLKMRYEIAIESLELIKRELKSGNENKAYEIATNDLARITGEHDKDCSYDVEWHKNTDSYRCECCLLHILP